LSIIRQLFHLGAIEAAEVGQIQPKKAKLEEVNIFAIKLF